MKRSEESSTFPANKMQKMDTTESSRQQSFEPPKRPMISELCRQIKGLYDPTTADFNFVFDVDDHEELVPVHKCIFVSQSPVFRQMFYGELKEKGDVKLTDTTIDEFVEFSKQIYSIETSQIQINMNASRYKLVLYLIHKYDVQGLEEQYTGIFERCFDEDITNILWILPLAKLYSYKELHDKCIIEIRRSGSSIIQSPKMVDCEKEVLKEILEINFEGRNEWEVIKMCIKWAQEACINAKLDSESPGNIYAQLEDLNCIGFTSITPQQMIHLVMNAQNSRYGQPEQIANDDISHFNIHSLWKHGPTSLPKLLEDHDLADVFFYLQNDNGPNRERLPAHKCILANKSEVFRTELQNTVGPVIKGLSPERYKIFGNFIRMIYVASGYQFKAILNEITDQGAVAVLSLAKIYKVEHIIRYYDDQNELILNEENVIRRFELSLVYSMDKLKLKCLEFMKRTGFLKSGFFLKISQSTLKEILKMHSFWGKAELVIDASMEWAENHCKNNRLDPENMKKLRIALGDAFEFIPFHTTSLKRFADFQRDHNELFTADEVRKVINQIIDRGRQDD